MLSTITTPKVPAGDLLPSPFFSVHRRMIPAETEPCTGRSQRSLVITHHSVGVLSQGNRPRTPMPALTTEWRREGRDRGGAGRFQLVVPENNSVGGVGCGASRSSSTCRRSWCRP